jgi:hypothetical protein
MLGSSRVVVRLAASQEVRSSMEFSYRNMYGEINVGMMSKRRKLFSLKTKWRKCFNSALHNMFTIIILKSSDEPKDRTRNVEINFVVNCIE